MSVTGLSTFDETVQLSNEWLNELMRAVDWDDKYRAYRLLRATLHALRDRLTAHEAVQFGAQLPMLIRGLYYDGWRMRDMPPPERTKGAFLGHIEAAFEARPERRHRGAGERGLQTPGTQDLPGEIDDVKHLLPPEVRVLWP